MDLQIQSSTPIVYEKIIPPPPRRLWGEDSPTEKLYHNKWVKYRNSMGGQEPSWSGLDAPRFVDFENIPDTGDSYFDHENEQKFSTPQKSLDKPLPGLEENNNNNNNPFQRMSLPAVRTPVPLGFEQNDDMLDLLSRCSISAIKKPEHLNKNNANPQSTQLNGSVDLMPHFPESSNPLCSSTIRMNTVNEADNNVPEVSDSRASNDISTEKPRLKKSMFEKKNKSDNRHCTITEPFSFETREKSNQEHKQARRERDSIGKETWKGFRANPVPSYLKLREKKIVSTKQQVQKKKPGDTEMMKLYSAAESWKKKSFQPSLPKKVAIVPKPPHLMTEIRARERQRFEEQLREKERQRQALQKMEEAARKKREEEEIAKLRKELVHKAQPIRKYKMIVPKMEKRPLPEPTTPLTCKRRRKV